MALSGIAAVFRDRLAAVQEANVSDSSQSYPPYVAGLWACDMMQSLLWEQCSPGLQLRLNDFPTWSWASAMAPVVWDDGQARQKPLCTVVSVNTREGSSVGFPPPVELAEDSKRFSSYKNFVVLRTSLSTSDLKGFNTDNKFATMRIRGRLQPVLVQELLTDPGIIREAAKVTGYIKKGLNSRYQPPWRKIASPTAADRYGGWGSFDHPEIQEDPSPEPDSAVFALHISQVNIPIGVINGDGKPWERAFAYTVLFLREMVESPPGVRRFRRLGVGRLFEKEMRSGFQAAEEEDLDLV